MATLQQVRTRVDAFLANIWPTIVARQQNYFANTGRYWQGLRTHTIVPAHTNSTDGDAVSDKLDESPLANRFSTWRNAFPEWDGLPIPAAFEVQIYGGPGGQGWFATIWVRYNGVLYSRSQNVGPEDHLTKAWHVVDESPN
jgi:hypothetical protein